MQRIPFIEERLIVSIFDYTGAWPQPYVDAGYPVLLWDLKHEGDIIKYWGSLVGDILNAIESGYYPYGLLAAPPCTDFAVSGARHWAKKDESTERCGSKDMFDNTVEMHVWLALSVPMLVDYIEQLTGYRFKFWALENPVGRIERLVPELKPFRKLLFNPCDYGDPYTKKTILWGDFNSNLVKNPVEPEYVTYRKKNGGIHRFAPQFGRTGGRSEKTKAIRSATPPGFAKAFFEANR